MPRIVPLQLLKCLKVLLDDYGGILSVAEVARIAGLMTKYSKKLVSKCIYVQILKCTKTELLDEFMRVGGWTLVHTWLNDSIRAMNWPLVQEILELLLLSPVDINRLKGNSAPKLVKGLCKDGGTEEVRILAKRLVDQWLKVVTENNANSTLAGSTTSASPSAIPNSVNSSNLDIGSGGSLYSGTAHSQGSASAKQKVIVSKSAGKVQNSRMDFEKDPLADVGEPAPEPVHYTLTPAQKKANQTGLVYKIIMKDGQQVLAKVAKPLKQSVVQRLDEDNSADIDEDEEHEESESLDTEEIDGIENDSHIIEEDNDNSRLSANKSLKDGGSSSVEGKMIKLNGEHRNSLNKKISSDSPNHSISKDRDLKSGGEKDKDRKSSKSSSSSGSKSSSSSHKSSSSSSKLSSSSSKSKSSSSSSSHHRGSSDKHRSDKDRTGSTKEHSNSSSSSNSSSNKHRSSSKSSSSSSSSRDRYRSDKDKEKDKSSSSSSSSSSKKDKEREKELQAEKDKDTLSKMMPPSLDKLGKIPKKTKPEVIEPQSITIPSKKASMSIEIRRDSVKTATVKTYKSQFRSHGLTEEAPPPPSRKGLKKPNNVPTNGAVIPKSLPSSLKRPSPPPRSSPTDKKAKIDINNVTVANEKPGAIKLIAPKKIQTLVETNLFSDALSAATGPKKVTKRKRTASQHSKDESTTPNSPTGNSKVAPLKFYQDTLDQSKLDEKANKENHHENSKDDIEHSAAIDSTNKEDTTSVDDKEAIILDDDDDIPLKKVKEDIEQKVRKELGEGATGEGTDDNENDEKKESDQEDTAVEITPKKPGPGCGPDGPPGVLILHRRKGPRKKLSWRPQEQLEEIRYFELDETERVNVTKTSFMDMKNMERFNERETINLTRRGLIHEDCMEPQIAWQPLIEVEDVPMHPDGSQSKQRKIQAEREMTTLRALYFSHAMIPDSPAEAEIEPVFGHDVPAIPLEDITGNPDAINDFTSMPWPEPKGSPKHGDNHSLSGSGGLGGGPTDIFNNMPSNAMGGIPGPMGGPNNNGSNNPSNPFNPFISPFAGPNGVQPNLHQQQQQQQQQHLQQMQMAQQGAWQGPPPNGVNINNPAIQLLGNAFNGPPPGSPNIDMGGGPLMGGMGQQFAGPQFGPQFGPPGFNGPNFRAMGPMGPMGPMLNGMMMGNPMMNGPGGGQRNGGNNNRNNNNWRNNGGGNGGNGGINNWRTGSSGQNRGGSGGMNNNNNTGVCKAFLRGHCRLGKSCKYIHPAKSKRI